MSEVFPTEVRSTGTSFIIFTSLIFMSALTKLFSQFVTWFGWHGTFFVYSSITLVCVIYGYLAMPDHTGVSLVTIEKQLIEKEKQQSDA